MEPMDLSVSLDEVDLEGLVACCLDDQLLLTAVCGGVCPGGVLPPALPPGLPPRNGGVFPDGTPPLDALDPAAPPPEPGLRPELE